MYTTSAIPPVKMVSSAQAIRMIEGSASSASATPAATPASMRSSRDR
jgi:hypothetical protein